MKPLTPEEKAAQIARYQESVSRLYIIMFRLEEKMKQKRIAREEQEKQARHLIGMMMLLLHDYIGCQEERKIEKKGWKGID